jgi:hypothetical protein
MDWLTLQSSYLWLICYTNIVSDIALSEVYLMYSVTEKSYNIYLNIYLWL